MSYHEHDLLRTQLRPRILAPATNCRMLLQVGGVAHGQRSQTERPLGYEELTRPQSPRLDFPPGLIHHQASTLLLTCMRGSDSDRDVYLERGLRPTPRALDLEHHLATEV